MRVKLTNNAETTLAGAINETATTVLLAPGTGLNFPTLGVNEFFPLTLVKIVAGNAVREIVYVTARNADSCTVVRAREGTTATTFSSGDYAGCHLTAASIDTKMDKDGGAFDGQVAMNDNDLSGAALRDFGVRVQFAPAAVGGVVTIDYRLGSHVVWTPTPGTYQIVITNWPPAGIHGELWIEGANLGACTITTQTALEYLKTDGSYTTTNSVNTNQGATLRTSGIDNLLIWGRSGAPARAKVAR